MGRGDLGFLSDRDRMLTKEKRIEFNILSLPPRSVSSRANQDILMMTCRGNLYWDIVYHNILFQRVKWDIVLYLSEVSGI